MSANLDLMTLFQKTADSGQINWSTVTRPGENTSGGYEIRRLNDSRDATAPIYVKIEYGTDITDPNPTIWITIGKGSNGSGTITNIMLSRYKCTTNNNYNTTTPWPSYYSCCDGFIGMLFCSGANIYGLMSFIIQRTVDDTGATNDDGIAVFLNRNDAANYGARMWCYNYATGYIIDSGSSVAGTPGYVFRPYGISNTQFGVSAQYQALRHWTILPLIRPLLFTCSTGIGDSITPGTTFQAAMVGTALRTYIQLPVSALGYLNYDRPAMIWE